MDISLIRRKGQFYIQADGQQIAITQQEAARIIEDHSAVYDIIVAHRRKFHFNTAEDRMDNLYREL